MPELAEVETVRRVLKSELCGLKITKIDLLYKAIFENDENLPKLINQEFVDILRQGKYLIFCFNDGYLLSHLRMEGKYFYVQADYPLNKHMHVIFYLNNGYKLIYQDVRKFGRMHYYQKLDELKADLKIGVDANIALKDIDDLYKKLKSAKTCIKNLLLDQSFIAGLGNIYVDEVLYEAKLLPNMPANLLSYDDLFNILTASQQILDKAILNKGTTIRSYTSSLGVTGNYQNYLKVHTKEKCPKGHQIITYKVGGRTSYVCPICQTNFSYVIGLTGSIASGKSNVANELSKMGFTVVDSDKLVKEAYNDNDIISNIKAIFKTTDKKEIGDIIFHDKEKQKELEKIIHPYVINKLKIAIENNKLVVLDIPLLFEANLNYLCNKIICCYLPYEEELKRLVARDNISIEYAKAKINSQMPLELKKEKADLIIDTSGTFEETEKNIHNVVKEFIYGIFN